MNLSILKNSIFFPVLLFCAYAPAAQASGRVDPLKESIMWDSAWTRFFGKNTEIFYDIITSKNPENSLDFVPTAEDIKILSKINPNGYGTGMEDGMILGGIMMCVVLDKYECTLDASLKKCADAILRGMWRCSMSPNAKGFVARAVSTSDAKSFFPSTSRDQYTHCIHALWRYNKSPLCSDVDRKTIAAICSAVADRMIEKIRPETNFDAQNADNTPSTLGLSKMWNVAPHEAARLPMIYGVAHLLTKNDKYLAEYEKYAEKSIEQSEHFSNIAPWAQLQMQISLEIMLELSKSDSQKQKITSIMERLSKTAARTMRSQTQIISSGKLNLSTPLPNPQRRPILPNGKPDMDEFHDIMRVPRCHGEMALTMLVRGKSDFDKESIKDLCQPLNKIDYDNLSSCALMFHLATYWSAKKHGIIE